MKISVGSGKIFFEITNSSDSPRYIYTGYASLLAKVPSDEPDYYHRKIITDDGRAVDEALPTPERLVRIEAKTIYKIAKGFRYYTPLSEETITAHLSSVEPRRFEKYPDFLKEHRDHLLENDVIAPSITCP